MPAAADALAAGAALVVLFYSVSDGNDAHVLVQVGLLLLGAVALFEHLRDLFEELGTGRDERGRRGD